MIFVWTETVAQLFFYSDQVTQISRRMTVDTCSFKCKKKYFKILLIRNLAGSQCNEHGTGVMCYTLVISRAAAGIAVYKGEQRVKKIYMTYDKSMD